MLQLTVLTIVAKSNTTKHIIHYNFYEIDFSYLATILQIELKTQCLN